MADAPHYRPAMGTDPRITRAKDPTTTVLAVLGFAVAAYVIAYPFTAVRYPPITDLPFHAAQASILRHYLDPSFHFREQFSLHPLEGPYLSMYALGALFAWVMPITAATKLMAIVMLSLVPLGLAVLFLGMKKSPLWGLAGLGLTWSTVTQWGFLNFIGAIGLFVMSVGLALLVVGRPSRRRQIALALCLVGIFFTHIYRVPFALLGVLVTGAVMYPATRRITPLFPALVPTLALFALWLVIRPHGMGIGFGELGFHPERVREIPQHLFGSYQPVDGAPPTPEGNLERGLALHMLRMGSFAIIASIILFFVEERPAEWNSDQKRWAIGVTVLPLVLSAGLFVAYLCLPYESGLWFYIYPREIVASVLFLVAAAPDLPRGRAARIAFFFVLVITVVPMTRFVIARFREFDAATADFRDVMAQIPKAPKLFYLMYWLGDSAKRVSPFLHLPAWVQAEKGGALGFHFVEWNHSPIRYRTDSAAVPPPLPQRFEWTPQYFRVKEQGAWFDTFLVRHRIDPHEMFDADKTIHLVAHRGTWWLYRRAVAGVGK